MSMVSAKPIEIHFDNLERSLPFFSSKVASEIFYFKMIIISLILKKNMFCKEFQLERKQSKILKRNKKFTPNLKIYVIS